MRRRAVPSCWFFMAAACLGAAMAVAGEAPRRIALEQWQMARIRTGSIVECEAVVKNTSGDRIEAIVVAAEFFGEDGKSLGRTPETAVDTMGGTGKGRQGLIARLAPGAGEQVVIRAPRIPAFATYRVTVSYSAAGRPAAEVFDGSLSGPLERQGAGREKEKVGDERLKVRIVRQSLSAGPASPGKPKKYTLDLLLKNASVVDATELEITLDVSAAGVPVKTLKRSLEPPVLAVGQERAYKVDCGELPPFDAHRISIAFKEPPPPEPPDPQGEGPIPKSP